MAQAKIDVEGQIPRKTLEWLATKPGYCQGLMKTMSERLVLEKFQQEIMEDNSKVQATCKARQTGYSFGTAADALSECQLKPGQLEILVSINLKDAYEKIRYADELHDSIPRKFKSKRITDNKSELAFANGSRIVTMFRPRGRGPANVRLDEICFIQDFRKVWQGSFAVTARGGRIILGSTLKGNSGMAYEILTGDTEHWQFKNINRRKVYWWQVKALCVDVKAATRPVEVEPGKWVMAAELVSTEERVEKWATPDLKALFYTNLLEDFQQEFELKPLEAEAAFISWELINSCAKRELEVYDTFEELAEHVQGELFAGVDLGRRRDASELVILERIGDRFHLRMNLTWHKMPFPEQEANLRSALEILPLTQMAIDETGMGMPFVEGLLAEYPHVVVPVNFGSKVDSEVEIGGKFKRVAVKERMATGVKIAMEKHDLVIPRNPELMRQIYSIKRMVGATGNVRYDAARNEKSHADKFWAVALALLMGKQPTESTVFISPILLGKPVVREHSGGARVPARVRLAA